MGRVISDDYTDPVVDFKKDLTKKIKALGAEAAIRDLPPIYVDALNDVLKLIKE